MIVYILRRLLQFVVVVFFGLLFIFTLSQIIPADPARAALGPHASEETVEKYRKTYGLDRPLPDQFVHYMYRLLQGDLGESILTTGKVSQELRKTIPATIELVVPATLLSTFFGIVPGVISASNSGKPIDHISRLLSLFGMSMPVFWFGLVLQLIFFLWLGLLPVGQRISQGLSPPPEITGLYTVDSLIVGDLVIFGDAFKHLILPVFLLSLNPLAIISRITRTSVLEVLSTNYIRSARAKGLTEATVLRTHALPNALIPIITILGLQFGRMLGGAVLVETIFSWPGIGRRAVQSIQVLDYPVAMGFTLYMIIVYSVVNLLLDISYNLVDPRIRQGTLE